MKHRIVQAEGGEQGDPLMPLLFSLGIHDSLCAVKEQLRPADELFAYLDDVHVASPPSRTRGAYNLLEAELFAGAGIRLHTGKTRAWNRGGIRPPDLDELEEDVWDLKGTKILGTPIGSEDFVQRVINRRLEDEAKLWDALTWVPDLAVRMADFFALRGASVETDFGQTDFGHRYPTDFGQTDFGQTDFGQTDFGQS